MDQFFQTVNKFYKTILKIALGVLGAVVTLGAGYGLSAMKALKTTFTGGGGWYTFLLVIYWIAVVAVILCGIYKLVEYLMKNSSSNGNNNYAQNNFNQQMNNGFNPQQQAVPQGEKFCAVCGGKIPAGNQFCPNCGNKM